jgi:hypothetical protein
VRGRDIKEKVQPRRKWRRDLEEFEDDYRGKIVALVHEKMTSRSYCGSDNRSSENKVFLGKSMYGIV